MRTPLMYLLLAFSLLFLPAQSFAQEEESSENDVFYLELSPGFVTNYGGPGRLKYLKADITLELGSARAHQAAEQHIPLVRNTIVLNLARQSENNVVTARGQERIRMELKEVLNRALEEEVGSGIVDEVLLTNFIYQN
ncbi:flagellar basal body-associated FliL family protein [Marinospirillum sp.]|uniref:flagellar basal body-associated FliL family protein n=1 Tax=Marinospirillum sp. TaxID=2183934 RepID=UPI00287043E7|nr:flagellar basal body-associated FliL family protein [Marinospirillum sp.]MDR9466709.1 flagellar basal body-associated FliL family protein [Marinospirillum sp.]